MGDSSLVLFLLGMILVIGYLGNYAIKLGIEAQIKQNRKKKKK